MKRSLYGLIACSLSIVASAAPPPSGKPTALMTQYAVAEQAFQRGDDDAAQKLYEAIVQQVNDQPMAQLRLGLIYQKQHHFRQALNAYDQVLLLPPSEHAEDSFHEAQAKAHFNRAVLLLESAAEDLNHIESDALDKPTDRDREELTRFVDAALATVGQQSQLERRSRSDGSAKGVVLTPPRPVVVAPATEAVPSVAPPKKQPPAIIRGGMD